MDGAFVHMRMAYGVYILQSERDGSLRIRKDFPGSCPLLYWPLELEPKTQFGVTIELLNTR